MYVLSVIFCFCTWLFKSFANNNLYTLYRIIWQAWSPLNIFMAINNVGTLKYAGIFSLNRCYYKVSDELLLIYEYNSQIKRMLLLLFWL